jgi:hypothetical protein
MLTGKSFLPATLWVSANPLLEARRLGHPLTGVGVATAWLRPQILRHRAAIRLAISTALMGLVVAASLPVELPLREAPYGPARDRDPILQGRVLAQESPGTVSNATSMIDETGGGSVVAPSSGPTPTPIPAAAPGTPRVIPVVGEPLALAELPTAAPTATPWVSAGSGLAVVGYGAGTTGGSGGTVYSVSSWAELKSALLAAGPRIVRLTGSANLDGGGDELKIKNGNLTIDGSGWSGSLRRYSIVIAASNVIVTQLRLRPGDEVVKPADGDALTINPGIGGSLSHVVIDHCSLLWGPDVTLAILNNAWDVTVQYSILGAGLYYSAHPEAVPPGNHSYGPNTITVGSNPNPDTEYGRRITFFRNYIVHNNRRNFRTMGTDGIEYVNNVVYNWGDQLARLNPRGANVVGNMFKRGPNTTASNVLSQTDEAYPSLFANSIYWADNLGFGFTPTLDLAPGVQRTSPYGGGLHAVTAATASSALASTVVAAAGPALVDSTDQLLKADFSNGSGRFYNGTGYPAPNPSW